MDNSHYNIWDIISLQLIAATMADTNLISDPESALTGSIAALMLVCFCDVQLGVFLFSFCFFTVNTQQLQQICDNIRLW